MRDFRPAGFQELPVVVKNLLIINGLVFLLDNVLQSKGIALDNYLALHYWGSPMFKWWQLITHMFMHGSFGHILSNMFALWMFGRILENMWGPQRFFIFYMVCGLGAALCHMSVLTFEFTRYSSAFLEYQSHPGFVEFMQFIKKFGVGINQEGINYWQANRSDPGAIQASINALNNHYQSLINTGTVGASGAVFGLLFAFGYYFPNMELYIYGILPLKAKYLVAGYALLELSLGVANSAGDNIAHFAHIGGMIFAFLMLRMWKTNIRNNF